MVPPVPPSITPALAASPTSSAAPPLPPASSNTSAQTPAGTTTSTVVPVYSNVWSAAPATGARAQPASVKDPTSATQPVTAPPRRRCTTDPRVVATPRRGVTLDANR